MASLTLLIVYMFDFAVDFIFFLSWLLVQSLSQRTHHAVIARQEQCVHKISAMDFNSF